VYSRVKKLEEAGAVRERVDGGGYVCGGVSTVYGITRVVAAKVAA
jgi:hypothetical protein